MYTLSLLDKLLRMDSNIILFFDLFGTMIFAITGAVKGIRNRLDLLGVLFFSVTVGCGGGMIRDVLIGSTPVAAFNDYRYFLVCIVAGLLCFILSPVAIGRWAIIVYCDAIGLGVFTALGVAKAVDLSVSVVGQIMSGMFTAVGGGIIRDVFSKEVPMVFTSDFYATASVFGAVMYVLLHNMTSLSPNSLLFITAVFTSALRIIGYRHHFKLPVARLHGEEKR